MASLLRLVDERRSPDARFWRQLTVGAVTLLTAAWLFGKVVEDVVTQDLLTVADEWFAAWLNQHATPGFTRAMLLATDLAGSTVVTGVSLATAVFLVSIRRWHRLLALVLVVPGGALLNELLRIVFQRARPTFDHPILTVTGYSFPSGHTMIATLLYGFLAVFLFQGLRGS